MLNAAETEADPSANGSAANWARDGPGEKHPSGVGCHAEFEGGLRLISLRDPPRFRPLRVTRLLDQRSGAGLAGRGGWAWSTRS